MWSPTFFVFWFFKKFIHIHKYKALSLPHKIDYHKNG
jgi:hypothetical protein